MKGRCEPDGRRVSQSRTPPVTDSSEDAGSVKDIRKYPTFLEQIRRRQLEGKQSVVEVVVVNAVSCRRGR